MSRLRRIGRSFGVAGSVWFVAPVALLATALSAAAQTQTSFRMTSTYADAGFGPDTRQTAAQTLDARLLWNWGSETSLIYGGQLGRDEDFATDRHIFRGRSDVQLRTRAFDVNYRHRPTQQIGIQQPANWNLRERGFGGHFHVEGLPQVQFESSHRTRHTGLAFVQRGEIEEERVSVSHSLVGLRLDWSQRWTDTITKTEAGSEPATEVRRSMRDMNYGVEGQRSLGTRVDTGASFRHSSTKVEGTSSQPDRSTDRDVLDGRFHARPYSALSIGGNASWEESRRRATSTGTNTGTNTDRGLDLALDAGLRPTDWMTATATRTYQDRRLVGGRNRADYIRGHLLVVRPLLPDLRATATFTTNWILLQDAASLPSRQLQLAVAGPIRPGAELTASLTAQEFVGAPAEGRRRSAQDIEFRLAPVRSLRLRFAAQAYRTGREYSMRDMDRIYYETEGVWSAPRGGSWTVRYGRPIVRGAEVGDRYSVYTSATVPWKNGDVSWNGQASRAREGAREWSTSTGGSARIRPTRALEFVVAENQTLPAIGRGFRYWSASLVQRF